MVSDDEDLSHQAVSDGEDLSYQNNCQPFGQDMEKEVKLLSYSQEEAGEEDKHGDEVDNGLNGGLASRKRKSLGYLRLRYEGSWDENGIECGKSQQLTLVGTGMTTMTRDLEKHVYSHLGQIDHPASE